MIPDVIVFLSSVLKTVGHSLWGGGVPCGRTLADQLNWTVCHRMNNQRGCLRRTTGYGIHLWTFKGERTYVKAYTFNRWGSVIYFVLDCTSIVDFLLLLKKRLI